MFEHLCCLSSVFAVTIEDQVARCSIFRESLSNLLRDPGARGMFRGIEVENFSPAMADHEEAVKHTKRCGRHRKEIHGRNRLSMVLQKTQPAPSCILPTSQLNEIPGYCALGNIKT